MPLEEARLLSLNPRPLPARNHTFGEEMAQLVLKLAVKSGSASVRSVPHCGEMVGVLQDTRGPKSGLLAPSSHLKKVVSNPLLLQALIHRPVMISVLDLCVKPLVYKLTKGPAGHAIAHLWLSLELLSKVMCIQVCPTQSKSLTVLADPAVSGGNHTSFGQFQQESQPFEYF